MGPKETVSSLLLLMALSVVLPGTVDREQSAFYPMGEPVTAMVSPYQPAHIPISVYFDDTALDVMILGNDYYEIAFNKWNGEIRYVTDKTTQKHVSDGSSCVWGAVFYDQTIDYEGGCLYGASASDRFAYTWSPAESQLTLTYTGNPSSAYHIDARVIILASPQPWFEMQMTLDNNWRYELDDVIFPSHLTLTRSDIHEAVVPTLPGVMLTRQFFSELRSFIADYPSLFADFLWVSSSMGSLTMLSIYDQEQIRPVSIGYFSFPEHPETVLLDHSFHAKIPVGRTWRSPRVRLYIGQESSAAIAAYRTATGLDTFRPLRAKLGTRYAQIAQSPILKLGMTDFPPSRFHDFPNLLQTLPSPAILHLVSYWQYGFDENYPDLLPPATQLGSTADFAAMVQVMQARGFLTMPYSNPTWWDDESPTYRQINPADVVLYSEPGLPRYECYTHSPDPPPCTVENARRSSEFNKANPYAMLHGGYVISPWAPQVGARLSQHVTELTEQVPNDILFQDQIGARGNHADYGVFAPSTTAFAQGWLEHTRSLSGKLLMTEGGIDRLAETEVGFNGGLLLEEMTGGAVQRWGNRMNWYVFPFAPMLVRDKVLFYQHNLAPASMTAGKQVLSWNASQGYMLTYNLTETPDGGGLHSPWLGLTSAFQKHVFARYADAQLTNYAVISGSVTRTTFDSFAVITNWNMAQSFDAEEYRLPPLGMLVTNDDGSLIAGIFTSYNGDPLSSGDHYLIEERTSSEIIVRQPMGADTPIMIYPRAGWGVDAPIEILAITEDGRVLESLPTRVSPQGINFVYRQQVAGQAVASYRIRVAPPSLTLTPTVTASPTPTTASTPTPTRTRTPNATPTVTPRPSAIASPTTTLSPTATVRFSYLPMVLHTTTLGRK